MHCAALPASSSAPAVLLRANRERWRAGRVFLPSQLSASDYQCTVSAAGHYEDNATQHSAKDLNSSYRWSRFAPAHVSHLCSNRLQRRASLSQQRLADSAGQLESLVGSPPHELSAVQCAGHMQQIADVVERLHTLSLASFAQHRDAAIRSLDVPMMRWQDRSSVSCDDGSVVICRPQIGAPVADVLSRWQQLTQHCEQELDAAVSCHVTTAHCTPQLAHVRLQHLKPSVPCWRLMEQDEQLRVMEQLLAFFAPADLPCAARRIHYVHLAVGVFGWQDERVRLSWEQMCETGEQGEKLLAVDITCVGCAHLELHSLWLTMHCPYTNQLVGQQT